MMFKKDDVVVFTTRCDGLVKEDERFVVRVLEDQEEQSHFVGQVIDRGHRATHRIGVTSHYWSAKQFKLKQQGAIGDNAFPVLKDGMVVTTRERGSYLVCADKVIRHDGYNRLASYEKDGKHKGSNSKFDIVRVYSGENLYNLALAEYVADYPEDLVWEEQKNAKAIAEIEEQVDDLQEQINALVKKLAALREEK